MDQPLFSEILIPLDEFESPEVIEERRKRCDEIAKAYLEKHGSKDLFKTLPIIIQKPPAHTPITPVTRYGDGKLMTPSGGLPSWYDADEPIVGGGLPFWYDVDEPIEDYQRSCRDIAAQNFRMGYKFVKGDKICISSEGRSFWSGMCYDSTWIAVYGMDSVCMVTRRREVDMTRVDAYYKLRCTNQQTMRSYAEAIICDVEALPYDDDLREKIGKSIVKPFGVVSLVPDTKIIHEESGHEEASIADYAAVKPSSKATMFLKGKMNSRSAFTFAETVQTAIRAFQCLCLEELKAEDIWVTTLHIAKNHFEHMHLDQRREHLGVIRGGSSSGGSGPSLES